MVNALSKIGLEVGKAIALVLLLYAVHLMDVAGWLP